MTDAEFRIVSPGATAEEIAAVSSVLQGALAELAEAADAQAVPTRTAWDAGRRNLRRELRPGPGAWRGFTG